MCFKLRFSELRLEGIPTINDHEAEKRVLPMPKREHRSDDTRRAIVQDLLLRVENEKLKHGAISKVASFLNVSRLTGRNVWN